MAMDEAGLLRGAWTLNGEDLNVRTFTAVSYTHLTLPTIYSV